MKKKNVTLVGMPGAGKSTLGVVLAKRLGMQFVDTDLILQERANKLLCEIIDEEGIDAFLEYENSTLAQLELEGYVIATGGSAVYGKEAVEHLREISTVVFIDIGFEEMQERLGDNLKDRGVVVRNGFSVKDMYDERYPLYADAAHITLKNDELSIRESAELLEKLITQENN